MSALDFSAVGLVVLGLLQLARLALAESLRNLDWLDRLGRFLLGAAFVCFGAARLTASGGMSRNVLGGLAVVLGAGSMVELAVRRWRARRVHQ